MTSTPQSPGRAPVFRKAVYSVLGASCALAVLVIGFGAHTDAFPVHPVVWPFLMGILTAACFMFATVGALLRESDRPSWFSHKGSNGSALVAQLIIAGLGWAALLAGGAAQ